MKSFFVTSSTGFSLWPLVLASSKVQRLKPLPQRSLKRKAAHDDRGVDVVPLRGDVFVGDLHVPLLAGHEWLGGRKKQALLVAQNHLIEWVVEFNRDFDL